MILCECRHPLRDTANPDRLRCNHCGHWTPHGRTFSNERALVAGKQIASLAGRIADDLAWLADIAHHPTRRETNGRASGHTDPTVAAFTNPRQQPTHAYTLVAARALERALAWLQVADIAAGEALQAAELPGPKDHVRAPYHDKIPENRPDLAAAHAAKRRRAARAEGWGTG